MRILAISADRGIAVDGSKGAAVHLRSLMKAMVRQGAEVSLSTKRMPKAESMAELGFPVDQLDTVAAAIEASQPGLVYERYSLGHAEGLRAARAAGVPFALEVNAPLAEEAARHRPDTVSPDDEAIEAELWRDADLVLPVSKEMARRVIERRGSSDGVLVNPNGVDAGLFSDLPERDSSARDTIDIGFLGHPKPWHGTGLLAKVIAGLRAAGSPARLVVVGGGRGADALLADFEERGLAQAIEITGALDQRRAIERLALCHVALAPYEATEDFYFCPLKVLESLAAGLPLISHPLGDIPVLVGEDAVLVEAGSADAIVAAALELAKDLAAARELGRRGRRRVLNNFSWDQTAGNILAAAAGLGSAGDARCS